MRSGLLFSLVVLGVAVGTCAGIELYSHLDVYDDVYIRHVSGRVRRSDANIAEYGTETPEHNIGSESPDQNSGPDDDVNEKAGSGFVFPERTTFTFTIKQTLVHLELKLNKHQLAHVPVNLVTKSGIVRYHKVKQRDYAYYQVLGTESAAAVRVRCPDFTFPCHMTGQFRVGDETYLVEPNSDKPRLVSKMPHKVYKVEPSHDTSFSGDTAIRTAPPESTGQETNQRRSKRQETNQRRSKRQAEGLNLKVELEMVVDYSLYAYWLDRNNGDVAQALSTIDEYYEQVANMMDLRFSSLTTSPGDMSIDIVPLEINVVNDSSVDTWISNNLRTHTDGRTLLEASPALAQFEAWAANNDNTLSDFDAILAFTRHNLGRFSADGTQATDSTFGLARQYQDDQGQLINGMCHNDDEYPATGLVEDLSSGATDLSATHELAHIMGAVHDHETSACSGLQGFIMDAERMTSYQESEAAKPWSFSPCTRATIQHTTNGLLERGRDCLLVHSYDVTEYWLVQGSRLLGEIYFIDDQCVLKEGVGSRRCTLKREKTAESICHDGIYCLVPSTSECSPTSVMPGTPCGTGRCIQGTCQPCDAACRLRKFLDFLRIGHWRLQSYDSIPEK